jgi:hypothetical protein
LSSTMTNGSAGSVDGPDRSLPGPAGKGDSLQCVITSVTAREVRIVIEHGHQAVTRPGMTKGACWCGRICSGTRNSPHRRNPERFFCASERAAIVPIPSLTSAEAFDSGVLLGAKAAERLIDHARQCYAAARRVETTAAVHDLPPPRKTHINPGQRGQL